MGRPNATPHSASWPASLIVLATCSRAFEEGIRPRQAAAPPSQRLEVHGAVTCMPRFGGEERGSVAAGSSTRTQSCVFIFLLVLRR